jgi:hypothetical protein
MNGRIPHRRGILTAVVVSFGLLLAVPLASLGLLTAQPAAAALLASRGKRLVSPVWFNGCRSGNSSFKRIRIEAQTAHT